MSKKFIIRITILLLLITTVGGAFILANEDPQNVSGIYNIFAENADSVKINDQTFYPISLNDTVNKINLKVTGCESKKSSVSLNGTILGYLTEGECSFDFDSSLLIDGDNEIRVVLTAGTETYTDGLRYGEYNLDDIVIEYVSITIGALEPAEPYAMIKYMPIAGKAGTTSVQSDYTKAQAVGDGWKSDTKLGGSTPGTPIYVGYLFEKPSGKLTYFSIDTKQMADAVYKVNIMSGSNVIETRAIKIDNTAPVLNISFNNGDTIANSNTIKFSATDSLPVTVTAQIDNIPVSGSSALLKSYAEGSHNLYVKAVDSLGNTVEQVFQFNVIQTIPDYELYKENGSVMLAIPNDASAKIYSVDLIGRINMYTNRLGSYSMTNLRSSDEVLASFIDKGKITTESVGNTLPYQSFVIDVGTNTGDAVVSYSGETAGGEDIILQVWNYKTSAWDTLAQTGSGVSISFKADISTYSKDGKMRVKASPDVISNGSDTLLWLSDTQYYTRYSDLNYLYTDIMNYAKDEYIAGNIGYVVHTGDLVDQTQSGDTVANEQFKVASDAQAILDSALVPNGVVSGNHDILHDKADYTYFSSFFGAERYQNFEWYGSSYKNNTHHYDLISIGNYDFLFLYLGCYDETASDTIAWANSAIQAYPERNVVICTHEFLLPDGSYSGDRAKIIWDEIVVPNENVKMILCGHNSGVCNQLQQVGDTDRYVLEILADYQYAELKNEISHVENGMSCDGEGYIRLMTFNEAGQVISTTYSPSAKDYNYYPAYYDSFVYDLDLIPAVRSITTKSFSVGVNIKEAGTFGVDKINLNKADGVYAVVNEGEIKCTTEILVLNDKTITYPAFGDQNHYDTAFELFKFTGMRGVSATLRRNGSNQIPDENLVESGCDLMPSETNKTIRASGSTDYIPTYTEDNKYTVKFSKDTSNTWVTTALPVNKTIDTDVYNRLYFGVTTDPNAKWNLIISFSNGKTINFSQTLYKQFGYESYFIPSDIQGTWQGYIPLAEYITGKVTVTNVYFTAATTEEPVVFDYFFIGKSMGKEILFVADEETSYSVDVLAGQKCEAISDPIKNGYKFDGWFTAAEGGDLIEFPAKIADNGFTAYAHFTKKASGNNLTGTQFFNDELEILPGADYNYIIIVAIISLTAIAGIVAAIFSALHHKKKLKENAAD